MFNNFRAIIFYVMLCIWHHHIHSSTITIPYRGTLSSSTTTTQPAIRIPQPSTTTTTAVPTITTTTTSMNYAQMAAAAQINSYNATRPHLAAKNKDATTNSECDINTQRQNSYIQKSQARARSQLSARTTKVQNIEQAEAVKRKRAHMQTSTEHAPALDNACFKSSGNNNSPQQPSGNNSSPSNGNPKNPNDNDDDDKYRSRDIIHNGKKYLEIPIINEDTQCIEVSVKLPYDGSQPIMQVHVEPIPIANSSAAKSQQLAHQHEQFSDHARTQDAIAQAKHIQKTLYDNGCRTPEQFAQEYRTELNNFLQKNNCNCSDPASIQLSYQGKTPIISYNEGNVRHAIGLQPNGCVYHMQPTHAQPDVPYRPSPLRHINDVAQATPAPQSTTPTKSTTSTPTATPPPSKADTQTPQPSTPALAPTPALSTASITPDAASATPRTPTQTPAESTTSAHNQTAAQISQHDTPTSATNSPTEPTPTTQKQSPHNSENFSHAQAVVATTIHNQASSARHAHAPTTNSPSHVPDFQKTTRPTLPTRYSHVNDLLQDYDAAIKMHHDKKASCAQSDNSNNSDSSDAHFDRLAQRAQALAETTTQCNHKDVLPYHTYNISPQARGFMMANNMDYAAFDGAHVTNFQHCLTQEIVGIIESCASTAQHYPPSSIINQLATYNCDLAISAQQLNQASHLPQAVAVIDVSHFFNAYTQFLVDSVQNASLGVVDGTVQALQKWGTFLQKLGCEPQQTIGKITDDCTAIGNFLYTVVDTACQFMPHAYLNDLNQGFLDNFHAITTINAPTTHRQTSSRMMQRTLRNAQRLQQGLYGALQIAQETIEAMMQKSLRQNVASGTEMIVDNMITAKATDCLIKIATCIGTPILQTAEKLSENIPSHLRDATPRFATNAGELIAVTETGESIGAAVAEQIIKNAAQAKAMHAQATKNCSGGNSGGGDSNKQKPIPAQTYTHEHGKYKASPKHHANSPDYIGKPPRDGQAALDNSFEVRKSTQRIAIQDGKVVVLKCEGNDIYHGYIVEDLNSLTKAMKDPLIEHGFMKNATAKKLIIK